MQPAVVSTHLSAQQGVAHLETPSPCLTVLAGMCHTYYFIDTLTFKIISVSSLVLVALFLQLGLCVYEFSVYLFVAARDETQGLVH